MSLVGTKRQLAQYSDMSGVEVKSEVAGRRQSEAIDSGMQNEPLYVIRFSLTRTA
jgi:hypothetical protein